MRRELCCEEKAVVQAARTARWTDELRAHTGSCRSCAEAARAAEAMLVIAGTEHSPVSLPDAERIWCAALLNQRRAEVARVQAPLAAAEFAAPALVVGGAGWWVYKRAAGIEGWWRGLLEQSPEYVWSAAQAGWGAGWDAAPAMIWVAAVLLAVLAVAVARPLLEE